MSELGDITVIGRGTWGARAPRSRTRRGLSVINAVYVHWPGVSGSLRADGATVELPDSAELFALADEYPMDHVARVGELPDVLGRLRTPEDEAADCIMPPDMAARVARIDTAAEERAYMREIQRFHMDVRGWSDFAYNYGLFRSGNLYRGRGLYNVPASQAPYNTSGVSVCCMIGTNDAVSDAMRTKLRRFVGGVRRRCGTVDTRGHREVNQTTCPGSRLMVEVGRL